MKHTLFFLALLAGCATSSAKAPDGKFHRITCDTIPDCVGKAQDTCNKGFNICSPRHFLQVPATEGVPRIIEVQCSNEQTGKPCE